jgi:hypothetical protein
MKSYFDTTYEVIDPETRERFVTADRFIAQHHYEDNCIVYEKHRTVTWHSPFNQTVTYSTLHWNDNPEFEEAYNEDDNDTDQ